MSLYGQNQPLALDGDEEKEDFGNWSQNHDFLRIKYLNVAIVAHVRFNIYASDFCVY